MSFSLFYCTLLCVCVIPGTLSKVTEDNCEVCVKFIRKFYDQIPNAERSDQTKIESHFKTTCATSKGKDERFCYYIGGLETSATYIVNELTQPLSWGMPAEKVCEKLKVKDPQVCDLKYDKEVDMKTVDLKKLKVKELRQILDNWGETCKGCSEKSEYIRMIEEKLPKYDPVAAKFRQENKSEL